MKTPIVSIVIPIYNVEKYLPRCLDSVTSQTYKNLEIILVDDGSPDNCGKICDQYTREDKRIITIHKENGGLSSARNTGINRATGKYIYFLDSDDWVDTQTIEILVNLAEEKQADLIEFGFREIHSDYVHIDNKCTADIIKYSSKEAFSECIKWGKIKPTAWNKLYLRSIIGKTRYPVGKLHEDEFTTHKFIYAAKKIFFLDLALYNYDCSRDDSITSKFKLANLDGCEAMRQKIHFITEHKNLSDLLEDACNVYCFTLFDNLSKCSDHKMLNTDKAKDTINAAINEIPNLTQYRIEPLYRQCLNMLKKEEIKECINKWKEKKSAL